LQSRGLARFASAPTIDRSRRSLHRLRHGRSRRCGHRCEDGRAST